MTDAGFDAVAVRQYFSTLSAPTKELEGAVLDNLVIHNQHPVLTWQAGQMTVDTDKNGNVKPSKKNRRHKIDGMSALVMAIGECMRAPKPKKVGSVLAGMDIFQSQAA